MRMLMQHGSVYSLTALHETIVSDIHRETMSARERKNKRKREKER